MSERNTIKTRKANLKECLLFSTLSEAELEDIAGLAVEREFEPGAAIFNEGDSARELFIIKEGRG